MQPSEGELGFRPTLTGIKGCSLISRTPPHPSFAAPLQLLQLSPKLLGGFLFGRAPYKAALSDRINSPGNDDTALLELAVGIGLISSLLLSLKVESSKAEIKSLKPGTAWLIASACVVLCVHVFYVCCIQALGSAPGRFSG